MQTKLDLHFRATSNEVINYRYARPMAREVVPQIVALDYRTLQAPL